MDTIKTGMSTKMIINVSSYQSKRMSGYLHHPFLGRTVYFSDTFEMISCMDHLLDELDFPQPSFSFRKFRDRVLAQRSVVKKGVNMGQNKDEQTAVKATFVVHVKYRQNATWQGTITWTERNVSKNFRSTFEMLKLMDDVIETETIEEQWASEDE